MRPGENHGHVRSLVGEDLVLKGVRDGRRPTNPSPFVELCSAIMFNIMSTVVAVHA